MTNCFAYAYESEMLELPEPTIADIERWLVARNTFSLAQDKFENVVRQIAKSKPSN